MPCPTQRAEIGRLRSLEDDFFNTRYARSVRDRSGRLSRNPNVKLTPKHRRSDPRLL